MSVEPMSSTRETLRRGFGGCPGAGAAALRMAALSAPSHSFAQEPEPRSSGSAGAAADVASAGSAAAARRFCRPSIPFEISFGAIRVA